MAGAKGGVIADRSLFIRTLALIGAGLLARPAFAQIPPPPTPCTGGTAQAWIEGRDVRAPIYNTGSLFWRNQGAPQDYTDGSGRRQLLAASLWIGALFDGFLFMAGSMLGPYEFWPGPLNENGLSPANCTPYDRIFEITRGDLLEYERAGLVSENLRNWPHWAGAPVSDGDGDPDNYDLEAGDRPALMGDQMLWWVMNDRGGPHVASEAIPLQIQVQASAFTFDLPGVLGRSTFYRYRFRRHGLLPLEHTRVGLFVYAGLGDIFDDYVGADTTLSMGYVYNADNNDEGFFGEGPPAVGVGILRGAGPDLGDGPPVDPDRALATRRMTSFVAFQELCQEPCNPYPHGRGVGFYNMMRGFWPWGVPIGFEGTLGGFLHTPVMFTGNPPEFWSESNVDGTGMMAPPGDRKMIVSTGPFTMFPDRVFEVVFAVVTSQGDDHLDSVRQLQEDMAFVLDRTPEILAPAEPGEPKASTQETLLLAVSDVWPNPATDVAHIRIAVPEAMPFSLTTFDLLGRQVAVSDNPLLDAGTHVFDIDTAGLVPGVYIYRVTAGRFSTTGSLVVQ